MKWNIPAKTFLLGEYAAIAENSAIILTTNPCFELSLTEKKGLDGIHPESPAGVWWQQQNIKAQQGLSWHDPYNGCGGLGASSAQFLATYLACCKLQHITPDLNSMLNAYYQSSWSGEGLRPSGYDVIAQSQNGCVFINKQKKMLINYVWPFQDLSFFLLHTGMKLATHHHLQGTALPKHIHRLSAIVDEAKQSFEQTNSEQLIQCINNYHHQLHELNLIAPHSLDFIEQLKSHPEVLAIKGCGAMGADILLIITARDTAGSFGKKLTLKKWSIVATEESLTDSKSDAVIKGSL